MIYIFEGFSLGVLNFEGYIVKQRGMISSGF